MTSGTWILDPVRQPALETSAAGAGGNASLAMQAQSQMQSAKSLDGAIRRDETPNISAAAANRDPLAIGLPDYRRSRLDMITYRIVAVGLPLLTVGIITGAM